MQVRDSTLELGFVSSNNSIAIRTPVQCVLKICVVLGKKIIWHFTSMLSIHRGIGAQHQHPKTQSTPAATQAITPVSTSTAVVIYKLKYIINH